MSGYMSTCVRFSNLDTLISNQAQQKIAVFIKEKSIFLAKKSILILQLIVKCRFRPSILKPDNLHLQHFKPDKNFIL